MPAFIESKWRDLAEFQLHIAERWRDRGEHSGDAFARFFFYFAGLNSLYFLWSKIDGIRGGSPEGMPNEGHQIEHLLGRLAESERDAGEIIGAAGPSIQFLQKRGPIERMDRRSAMRFARGEAQEGSRYLQGLGASTAKERLLALGRIIYLVRSNLVHGSKADSGDDESVITNTVPVIRLFLDRSLTLTRNSLG